MSDEHIRYAYRICPCFPYDIEGIQTWLEDMASQGLVLEADGTFLGIFTFQKTTPKKYRYRLAPLKEQKGFFSDSLDGPNPEEQEFSEKCGWQYLVRYGHFYIYRTADDHARPLHTDPSVHVMALAAIKKQQISTLITLVLNFFIYSFLSTNIFSFFRSGAVIGLGFVLCLIILGLFFIGEPIGGLIYLSRYQKKLRSSNDLDQPKPWRSKAIVTICIKCVPWIAFLALLSFWGISLNHASCTVDVEYFTPTTAFADLRSMFPEGEIKRTNMGDYNTAVAYSTALSSNIEWNEAADITDNTGSYYGILRMEYHDTVSPLFAKGLADDYYRSERLRYRGKRFENLEAPETRLDEVRIYSSYGILHVLIQHEDVVVHAVVTVSQQGQNNQWQRWIFAMEDILLH
jgi:hypothetical protein